MTARNLKLVQAGPEPTPEERLADLVPQLIEAERKVADLRNQVDIHRRRLALDRGVAFIRPEHVRREFAG